MTEGLYQKQCIKIKKQFRKLEFAISRPIMMIYIRISKTMYQHKKILFRKLEFAIIRPILMVFIFGWFLTVVYFSLDI